MHLIFALSHNPLPNQAEETQRRTLIGAVLDIFAYYYSNRNTLEWGESKIYMERKSWMEKDEAIKKQIENIEKKKVVRKGGGRVSLTCDDTYVHMILRMRTS